MRALKICLWIAGILCLLSAIAMFLPGSVWASVAKAFGVELALPLSPLFVYVVRLTLATYAAIGAYLIILARDPMKYGIMVPFTGLAPLLLGTACAITGTAVSMPVQWFLGDAIPFALLGILIAVFWRQAKQQER